jgi:hypothetical protein
MSYLQFKKTKIEVRFGEAPKPVGEARAPYFNPCDSV